jgi:hypothetical protein
MKQICYLCGAEMPCIAMIGDEPVAWICEIHGVMQDGSRWVNARYPDKQCGREASGA